MADNGFNTAIPVIEKDNGSIPVPKATAVEGYSKGDVADDDPPVVRPVKPVEWITIPGGKFMMGTDSGEKGLENAKPVHEVTIKSFDMSKTEVTVEQYKECVDKGECQAPSGKWDVEGLQFHPVVNVSWVDANQYTRFMSSQPGYEGARLPSESEWEYAAKSGGKNWQYPWGNDEPTCGKAVMYGHAANVTGPFLDASGCGKKSTWPVCSKRAGNTKIDGLPADKQLCDMAGNVWEWVRDSYKCDPGVDGKDICSYKGVPTDGAAFLFPDSVRVVRGGSLICSGGSLICSGGSGINLRADYRYHSERLDSYADFGFRIARSR
jgi:formylglycine-generating enzyme required for sulfatase activity